MVPLIKRIVRSPWFERGILLLILAAAALVGVETYPSMVQQYGGFLSTANTVVLAIFVLEAVLKMAQHGPHFLRYFRDPWNVFDFTIVVVCVLPIDASYAAVLRMARIMRALRLMTALPKLQLIVSALIKSIPSMMYVGLLLLLNFYVYAVMGVMLFGKNDPVHFQDLPTAMLTLFRVVTLEDWTDVMYIQMYGSHVYAYDNTTGITPVPLGRPLIGAAFFVSFVMFATMIMLNLFIGVIINSMDEAQKDSERIQLAKLQAAGDEPSALDELDAVQQEIEALQQRLRTVRTLMASRPYG